MDYNIDPVKIAAIRKKTKELMELVADATPDKQSRMKMLISSVLLPVIAGCPNGLWHLEMVVGSLPCSTEGCPCGEITQNVLLALNDLRNWHLRSIGDPVSGFVETGLD